MVLVRVDPSDPTDINSQAQARIEGVLRREDPDKREFILDAVAKDKTIGVDTSALRRALLLSPPQMAELRNRFFASPLRRLTAEQPPFLSPCQLVVDALVQDVTDHSGYLSIQDVEAMAMTAAIEVRRRTSGDVNSFYAHLLQITMTRTAGYFSGRTSENDPWLRPRWKGAIELHVTGRLERTNDVLPALLKAPARWLDMLLYQAVADGEQLTDETKHRLMEIILVAYESLLNQCFALGEGGPQNVHRAFQHCVRGALDKLKFPEVPVIRTPGVEQVRMARGFAEQINPSVLPGKSPANPSTTWTPIDESRQQARAGELHIVAAARELLQGELELQQELRCLQHAYNNGWYYWLKLHQPGAPLAKLRLTQKEAVEAQELDRIDHIVAPDGCVMQRLRLMPAQLLALMPALEEHLDLAIVFKGPTDLIFGDARAQRTHHYTALIRVNGLHFELDSVAADAQSGKRWVPKLKDYFEDLQGGAYMAIRGGHDHPLSKYVTLISIELFWRTCEAFGVFLGKQPIMELAQFLPVKGLQDAARAIRARSAAEFCKSGGFPGAAGHHMWLQRGSDRTQAIMRWLTNLGTDQGLLWTGTDPLVVAVKRGRKGNWIAHTFDRGGQRQRRPLAKVLDEQQAYFKTLPADDLQARAGFVQFLTLGPPDADASLLGFVQSADRPMVSRPPAAHTDALPQPDGAENFSGVSKETQQAAAMAKQPHPSKKRRAEQAADDSASRPRS